MIKIKRKREKRNCAKIKRDIKSIFMDDNVNERKEKKRMRLILISYNDIKVITDRASTCGARFLLNAGDFLTVRISLYSLYGKRV